MTDLPAVVAASTTQEAIAVDAKRWHHLMHTGFDSSGSASTDAIQLAFERDGSALTVDNDYSEGPNKAILPAGKDIYLPPGCGSIAFRSAAGTPTMNVVALAPDPFS